MRRLLFAAAALVLVLVVLFGLALALVDPQSVSRVLAARAAAALDRPVALGEVDLMFFPAPAARVRDVVVGGDPGAPPLAEIDEIRVRVSLLALLGGRVVLRGLDVDAPRIQLALDDAGVPQLPSSAPRAEPEPEAEASGDGPLIAITRLRIRDGRVEAGPWRAENLKLEGSAQLDRSAELELEVDLPGVARLREARVELEGLGAGPIDWRTRGRLEAVDLAALGARLELGAAVAGRAEGPFAVSGRDALVDAGRLDLEFRALRLSSGALGLGGDASASAEIGESFRVDLTGAELRAGEALHKPAGERLALSGPLGWAGTSPTIREIRVALGPSELPGAIELGGDGRRLELFESSLELEPLRGWWRSDPHPSRGRVRIRQLRVDLEPLSVTGGLELEAVEIPLEHGTVSVSGPVRGEGGALVGEGLRVSAGGQTATLGARYELATGDVVVDGEIAGADLDPLAQALVGSSPLTGTLAGSLGIAGPPRLASLRGGGSFELAEGQIRGFSIMRSVLGELAVLPIAVAQLRGRDLSRYEEEEFRRLAGAFRVQEGIARVDELTLEYRHATVDLRGTVSLSDGALDLAGSVVLGEELDAELGASEEGERVIPISGVRGTLNAPRVVLDRAAVSSALATYAGRGRVREELEEKLGTEGADAVEDVLDQLLRGGREEP